MSTDSALNVQHAGGNPGHVGQPLILAPLGNPADSAPLAPMDIARNGPMEILSLIHI